MSAPATAAFRTDGSAVIGGGHVMRCLTLARELAARGTICAFFVGPDTLAAVPALGSSGFPVHQVDDGQNAFAGALSRAWPEGADLAIFDHYGLDQEEERRIAPLVRKLFVIDDLVDRPHHCDMLLDQTVGRDAADYRTLVNAGCRLLAGGDYALLRPEFAALAPTSLARRAGLERAARILVSMGLTDVGGVTASVVAPLVAASVFTAIDVVLARSAPSRILVERWAGKDDRVRLHEADSDIARLMTQADIAIGAAGATSWERCCLGLPTIMLQLADNQRKVVAELVGRDAAILAPAPDAAAELAMVTATDPERLSALSRQGALLIDGKGASRVVEAIKGLFRPGE